MNKTASGHIQRDRDESRDQFVPALLYVTRQGGNY